VVVPDASMSKEARRQICQQLKAVGFSDAAMLTEQPRSSAVLDVGPRVVAA
jgi:polysaccharide biosynthesis transport protein